VLTGRGVPPALPLETGVGVDPAELRWGHGDGLVLRGLSELPVVLRR
jgi:hypothetical protein